MSKKNELGAALGVFQDSATTQPQTVAPAAPAQAVAEVLPENLVEALKGAYGEKWSKAAKRGNPYGRVNEPVGNYIRASFVMDAQQHKAIRTLAERDGLQLKEAMELIVEVGLYALTGKGSEDIVVTPLDTMPKYKRHKTRKSK